MQHRVHKFHQYIAEAETGSADERPDQLKFTLSNVKTAGTGLFKTGSAAIDTKSPEFQQALRDLLPLGSGQLVEVQGGASAVGSKQGFNNSALAMKRALNFVQAVRSAGANARFVIIAPAVGTAERYNSPEALAEQFVKYAFETTTTAFSLTTARDNTANRLRVPREKDLQLAPDPSPESQNYSVYYQITYNPKTFPSASIKQAIDAALKGKVVAIKTVSPKSFLG